MTCTKLLIVTLVVSGSLSVPWLGSSFAAPAELTEVDWLNDLLQSKEPQVENLLTGYGRGFSTGVTVGVTAASTSLWGTKILQCLQERRFSPLELRALAHKFLMARGDLFDQVKPATELDALTALDKLYWFALREACQLTEK